MYNEDMGLCFKISDKTYSPWYYARGIVVAYAEVAEKNGGRLLLVSSRKVNWKNLRNVRKVMISAVGYDVALEGDLIKSGSVENRRYSIDWNTIQEIPEGYVMPKKIKHLYDLGRLGRAQGRTTRWYALENVRVVDLNYESVDLVAKNNGVNDSRKSGMGFLYYRLSKEDIVNLAELI